MNRRGFLGATLASAAAACGMPLKESAVAPPRVALADVRRLVVERADPIAGRCRYVADLGARQVPQPILFARRGESFDGVIENALPRSEEHTSELQSQSNLVCRLLLEKKKKTNTTMIRVVLR